MSKNIKGVAGPTLVPGSGSFPLKLGFHIRGKRKRLAAAVCGCGMRYANDLIPYIRLPMRLHSLFLSE